MRNWNGFIAASAAIVCCIAVTVAPTASHASTNSIVNSGVSQTGSGWGLASALGVSNVDSGNYWYPVTAGEGATVYIVDSGVSQSEDIFGNRVTEGFNALTGDMSGSATTDCTGHGTEVAAVAASSIYGVAKKATIVPVKVGECDKTYKSENIISGLEWIRNNTPSNGSVGVVNLSFGFINDSWYDDGGLEREVQLLIDEGFFVTVAAGNNSSESDVYSSCDMTPARMSGVFTVGAYSKSSDDVFYRAGFSNSGDCVDIWAPGGEVATRNESSASNVSGTSVAAPYVAGLAALLVGDNDKISASELSARLVSFAGSGLLSDNGEHLLNANVDYVSDSYNRVYAESVDDLTVNLVARMPFNVPEAPAAVKNVNINRFWGDAYLSWNEDVNIYNQSKVSYIIEYAKVDSEGYVNDEVSQVFVKDYNMVLHDLGEDKYAYRVAAVNDGRIGEYSNWVEVPVLFFCVAGVCFA